MGPEISGSFLEEEDQCPEGGDDACALSLRQLRGVRRTRQVSSHLQEVPHFSARPPSQVKVGISMGNDVGLEDLSFEPIVDVRKEDLPFADQSLFSDSSAPLQSFYMYRAISDEKYEPVNVNAANLAGVLWYLHHEVVVQAPRKFNIARIARFKVSMRATTPLLQMGMHFGVRFAFDRGQATGPFVCGKNYTVDPPIPEVCAGEFQASNATKVGAKSLPYEWEKYGYTVGCNNLGSYPFPLYSVGYPGAVWYSLPGPCPSRTYDKADDECRRRDPGGFCGLGVTPTGAGNCTWTYEKAGNITVDELVNITDYWGFVQHGGKEYDPYTDNGTDFTFWDGINNQTLNLARIKTARDLFDKKYPNMTSDKDLPQPPCDFSYKQYYRDFHMRDANFGPCEEPKGGSECAKAVQFAMSDGIYGHPDWYPGLTPKSSRQEFQQLLFQQGLSGCKRPCGPYDKPEKLEKPEKPEKPGKPVAKGK